MKRIEFIAPVEAMRGNLSGKQVLEYPEQNNAAFDAPANKRSYARNYQSRFIGAKRASDGLKYFQVRTKSAIGLTAKSKMAMALLGATGAIRAALKKMSAWDNIVANYEIAKAAGATNAKSVAKWVYDAIYETLKVKGAVINFAVTGGTATRFKNPFVKSEGATASDIVGVPGYILVKFWLQLANNPIIFTVEGQKGVAHGGGAAADTFQAVSNKPYNVLGLTIVDGAVKMGEGFVCFKQENVDYGAEPTRVISENGAPEIATLEYFLNEIRVQPWSD